MLGQDHPGRQKRNTSAALDFGQATSEGYKPYTGPLLDTKALLASFDKSTVTGSELFRSMEEESASTLKEAKKRVNDIAKTVLRDPIDYLLNLDKDVLNVDDLVSALSVSHEEVKFIAEMTTGQWENPLWMDARQWRSQPAILDRFVIGNAKEVTHHHSTSTFLGVYGYPVSPAISWGIQHESDAINMLESIKKVHVEPCGICISEQYPFLGASPDGIIHGEDSGVKLVEVKCPFKH